MSPAIFHQKHAMLNGHALFLVTNLNHMYSVSLSPPELHLQGSPLYPDPGEQSWLDGLKLLFEPGDHWDDVSVRISDEYNQAVRWPSSNISSPSPDDQMFLPYWGLFGIL